MKPLFAACFSVAALFCCCEVQRLACAAPLDRGKHVWSWNFDEEETGKPPSHFSFGRTGAGRSGRWMIQADKEAPSGPNVLAQLDEDPTDYRFAIAVAEEPELRDFRLHVRCKAVAGRVDQAAGLVFRYQDENNYYVTRANALENNIRLYKVVGGRRQQFAGWDGPVTANAWHEYRVNAQGDHFEIYWDGQKVMDARDRTFSSAGKVGFWTKADSVIWFDDLTVQSIGD
ncbi:MAG: DUF1080 domain-containing protein [Candidatus Omnitrophica bacterium]|nr:DUF1080 domain-containing protein [Candidatus Omnitrophota bacterium]